MTDLQILQNNCNPTNLSKLSDLFKAWELAKIGREMHDSICDECIDKALADNYFFASEDFKRVGIKKGGRVLSHNDLFAISNEDFDKVMELSVPLWVAAGETDEEGNSIIPWVDLVCDARWALVDFIIEQIIPVKLRPVFLENRRNVTQMNKLIEITRAAFFGNK